MDRQTDNLLIEMIRRIKIAEFPTYRHNLQNKRISWICNLSNCNKVIEEDNQSMQPLECHLRVQLFHWLTLQDSLIALKKTNLAQASRFNTFCLRLRLSQSIKSHFDSDFDFDFDSDWGRSWFSTYLKLARETGEFCFPLMYRFRTHSDRRQTCDYCSCWLNTLY